MNISKLSIFLLATSAFANYIPITDLSQFGSSAFSGYGLLANGNAANHNFQLTSDSNITANVGFDNSTNEQALSLGNGAITGNYNASGTNTALGGGGTVSGTIAGSVVAVHNAVLDAQSLASTYGAATSMTPLSGSINITSQTGNDGANEFVYSAGVGLQGLTITGTNSQYVIINVGAGSSSNYALNSILLAGGITADHVLVNVETTGGLAAGPNASQGNVGNPVVNAIVIDDSGKTNLNSITINGSLYCSTGAGDCQFVSNATLNQQPFTTTSATPEPSTWLLGICGVMAIAGLKRFRKQQS